MTLLLVGLALFLGTHLSTIARGNRRSLVARLGEGPYKGIYSLLSIVGFVLLVIGFGRYRANGYIAVWEPPVFTRHLALLLVWLAFVSLTATYVPSHLKARLKHPMLVSVKIWATAHLLANGDLGSILLFGSFLAWAVIARISIKRRTDAKPLAPAPKGWGGDAIVVVVATAVYLAFLFKLHFWLIGVPVLPGR